LSIVEKAIDKLRKAGEPLVVGGLMAPAAELEQAGSAPRPSAGSTRAAGHRQQISLDQRRLHDAGLLPPDSEAARVSSEYRRIKRPIVAHALSSGVPESRVVVVASAAAGEGKTFTALNLAFSLSLEQDASVLLVDADAPKPNLTTLLGLEGRPGLLDVLAQPDCDAEDYVFGTDIPKLAFLPIGQRAANATELMASQRMRRALSRLLDADTSRIIVIDSPPVLQTTEAAALLDAAGQVALVVRAALTPRQAVMDTIRLIGTGKKLGLVLNEAEPRLAGSLYHYYGYGQYGS
jgi:exopolysaccharide/PEP-CTERM locus tyrosine autokinase